MVSSDSDLPSIIRLESETMMRLYLALETPLALWLLIRSVFGKSSLVPLSIPGVAVKTHPSGAYFVAASAIQPHHQTPPECGYVKRECPPHRNLSRVSRP